MADLIERDSKKLAALETLDNGKPFERSIIEMHFSAHILRCYAGYADKIHGKTIPAGKNSSPFNKTFIVYWEQ